MIYHGLNIQNLDIVINNDIFNSYIDYIHNQYCYYHDDAFN